MNHFAYRMGARFTARLLGLVLLGFLLLPLAGADTGSRYVPSLWVVTRHALVRLSATDGAELKRVDFSWRLKPKAIAESAIDGEVWVLFRRSLRAWSATGIPLVEVSLSRPRHHGDDNSDGHSQATLAVDVKGGVLWLSRGRRLYRYNLQGKLQARLKFHRRIRAITLDTAHSVLWVATGRTIKAYNATGEKIHGIMLGGWSRVKALAWPNKLSGLWVLRGRRLSRYSADGTRVLDFRLPRRLGRRMTSDGSGALWVVGGGRMARIDSSGLIEFVLRPFAREDDDDRVALVANPGDHSAWVAARHRLAHVSAVGVVLKTIDLNHDDEGEQKRHHHKGRDLGSVYALALWADVIPPRPVMWEPAPRRSKFIIGIPAPG